MPNIKQQKKRVRTAADERLENLRYRSTIKTLTKRLRDGGRDGRHGRDRDRAPALVKLIDRAVTRGALHRNAAARKKSQAPRGSPPPRPLACADGARRRVGSAERRSPRSGRAASSDDRRAAARRSSDQRPLELELVREARAALERVVELGEADQRVVELVAR